MGARLLAHRARLLLDTGQYAAALAVLREGGNWLVEASERPVTAVMLHELGRDIWSHGAAILASARNQQGLRIWLLQVPKIPWIAAAFELANFAYYQSIFKGNVWGETREVEFLAVHSPEDLIGPWHMSPLTRTVLDLQPSRELIRLSGINSAPQEVRRALFAAGFVRLHLLGRDAEALGHLDVLRALFPELATEIQDLAKRSQDPQFAVVRFLLRVPGFTPRLIHSREQNQSLSNLARDNLQKAIDSYNPNEGNWWCRLDPVWMRVDVLDKFNSTISYHSLFQLHYDAIWIKEPARTTERLASVSLAESFVSHPLFASVDWAELEALSLVEPGPIRLGQIALERARARSSLTRWFSRDESLAETLHWVVRATRYGCRREAGIGVTSREAFQQLHRLFPGSEWSKRTPYWFDMHQKHIMRP